MNKLIKQYEKDMKIQELMLLLAYQRWFVRFNKEIEAIEEIIK